MFLWYPTNPIMCRFTTKLTAYRWRKWTDWHINSIPLSPGILRWFLLCDQQLTLSSVSLELDLNLDYLLEEIWEHLALVRIYTKKPGSNGCRAQVLDFGARCVWFVTDRPDFGDGNAVILRRGATIEHVVSLCWPFGSERLVWWPGGKFRSSLIHLVLYPCLLMFACVTALVIVFARNSMWLTTCSEASAVTHADASR